MQLGRDEICRMVADENSEFTIEFLKEVDKFIFSTLRKKTNSASSLIYDLSPLGKWSYRKVATIKYLYGCKGAINDFTDKLNKILEMYEIYVKDKLEKKYEQFGKENHEAYILVKKQERLQKWKETQSKEHS